MTEKYNKETSEKNLKIAKMGDKIKQVCSSLLLTLFSFSLRCAAKGRKWRVCRRFGQIDSFAQWSRSRIADWEMSACSRL